MIHRSLRVLWGCAVLLALGPSTHAQTRTVAEPSPAGRAALSVPDNASQVDAGAHAATKSQSLTLTLADAEVHALKNQPRLLAEQFRTQAADKRVVESRSGYFPQAFGNLTAVEANGDTAVAAGALTTSSISTRAGGGTSIVQMITDFGRTSNLVQSAHFAAMAAGQNEEGVRQSVLMQVREAYFTAQAAESIRKTAQAVLDFRRVTLRQLSALAQSQLRSTLDVQFAQVMVSEAELAAVRAESNVLKAQAQLAASMGEEGATNYTLTDEPLPASPDNDPSVYIDAAIASRPDLKALHLESESTRHEARAQRDLNFPTINALAAGGEIPIHDSAVHHEYGAAGININIPLFNGGLYSARAAEARLEAKAADKDGSLREVEIVRDVRVAWADARDAYQQIDVTQRLADEANVAMHLAQARYDAGLGSIVELNQAELNQTSALITAASARFDYLRSMTAFQFALGDLH
ncbi:MAG TPA: TolC family protein [Terracidiphilus sp.]|jgi:outer membrane protein|nr:TolC family protein [Terracidiphilus sp.]